jgi:hypothetical protein
MSDRSAAGVPDAAPPDDAETYAAEIAAIARTYSSASGPVMKFGEFLGSRMRGAAAGLPDSVERALLDASRQALEVAYRAASATRAGSAGGIARRLGAEGGDRAHRFAAMMAGAAGGSAGLATALAELPMTTTLILRSIQDIAAHYGEDPATPEVKRECLMVFAQGGPFETDDDVDFGFVGARIGGATLPVAAVIPAVARRFGLVVGQKLAAQAAPFVGAVMGAALNTAFMTYFQTMAHVRFRLRQLQRQHGAARVAADFRDAVSALRQPALAGG